MATWRIKEMSDLTKISIRMLRHYDKLGLLKPSTRTENGYRWYSEADLAKLQQIIALKFFGFNLKAIKTMLQTKLGIASQLRIQQEMLKSQMLHLQQAQQVLDVTLQDIGPSEVPDWNNLILLIERYRMTNELKNTWAKKTLNEEQMEIWSQLCKKYPKELAAWEKLIEQINNKELGDPEGPQGQTTVKTYLDILKKTKDSFSEQRKLSASILRSVRQGTISNTPLTAEGNIWIAKASLAYWLDKWDALYKEIGKHVTSDPTGTTGKKIAAAWRNLIDEQFLGTSPVSGTSPSLAMGTILWQEIARQKTEITELKTVPSTQEQIKKIQVPLFFDPEALEWIETALDASQE